MPTPAEKPPSPDWERIEAEFRAGQLSIREIGRTYEITEGAIRYKAKALKWQRALADKVRNAVDEKLAREPTTQSPTQGTTQPSRARTDAEIIDTAAARGVEVVRQHRKLIGETLALFNDLKVELKSAIDNRVEIDMEIVEDTKGKGDGRRRFQMQRAVDLPSRAQVGGTLSVMLKNLIAEERRAFNLDKPGEGASPGDETPHARFYREISGTVFRPKE